MIPLTEYTIENEIKIAIFDVVGNSIPLYEKNLTIVESITITEVIIKMKIMNSFWSMSYKENHSTFL